MIKSDKGVVSIQGTEDEIVPKAVLLLKDLGTCLDLPAIPTILATYYLHDLENGGLKIDCKQAMVNLKRDVLITCKFILITCKFIMQADELDGDTIEEKVEKLRKEMEENEDDGDE